MRMKWVLMPKSIHEEIALEYEAWTEMPTCWGHVCMALQTKFTGHQRSWQEIFQQNVCNYNNHVRGWMNEWMFTSLLYLGDFRRKDVFRYNIYTFTYTIKLNVHHIHYINKIKSPSALWSMHCRETTEVYNLNKNSLSGNT